MTNKQHLTSNSLGMRIILVILLALFSNPDANAQPPQSSTRIGDVYEIRHEYKTESRTGESSKGSASGRSMIVERVIAIGARGTELEFDLPAELKEKRKDVDWQYPARVLKLHQGSVELLNTAELESRVDAWLEKAKWPRTVCGQWIFTWNAFRIECDPQMVLGLIDGFNLESGISADYSTIEMEGTLNSVSLIETSTGPNGTIFGAEFVIDPTWVRKQRIEQELVTAQIMGDELTQPEAESRLANHNFSGTINVEIKTATDGNSAVRTTITQLQIRKPDGEIELNKSTEILTRKLVSRIEG